MQVLKKENWWIWLLLLLFSGGSSYIVLGALLDVYNKNAWYTKWYIWILGLLFIVPFFVMIIVFNIDITTQVAAKLKLGGYEFYLSPYIWLILFIIPIIGWILLIILYLYINIGILVQLYKGYGEKYIN